jgi:hypothetical protein
VVLHLACYSEGNLKYSSPDSLKVCHLEGLWKEYGRVCMYRTFWKEWHTPRPWGRQELGLWRNREMVGMAEVCVFGDLYYSPKATVSKYHKLSGFKWQKFTFSQFWKPEDRTEDVGGAVLPLKALEEAYSFPPPLFGGLRCSLVCRNQISPSFLTWCSSYVSVAVCLS